MICRRVRAVDIAPALALLPGVVFTDTGGTNGWLADPAPLLPFVAGLGLGAVSFVNLRKLPAGQGIPPHIDPPANRHPSVLDRRFHLPLVTHRDVVMRWPDDRVALHLEAGWLYEVDHHRLHEVINRAPIDRIHLVIDTAEVARNSWP